MKAARRPHSAPDHAAGDARPQLQDLQHSSASASVDSYQICWAVAGERPPHGSQCLYARSAPTHTDEKHTCSSSIFSAYSMLSSGSSLRALLTCSSCAAELTQRAQHSRVTWTACARQPASLHSLLHTELQIGRRACRAVPRRSPGQRVSTTSPKMKIFRCPLLGQSRTPLPA